MQIRFSVRNQKLWAVVCGLWRAAGCGPCAGTTQAQSSRQAGTARRPGGQATQQKRCHLPPPIPANCEGRPDSSAPDKSSAQRKRLAVARRAQPSGLTGHGPNHSHHPPLQLTSQRRRVQLRTKCHQRCQADPTTSNGAPNCVISRCQRACGAWRGDGGPWKLHL